MGRVKANLAGRRKLYLEMAACILGLLVGTGTGIVAPHLKELLRPLAATVWRAPVQTVTTVTHVSKR